MPDLFNQSGDYEYAKNYTQNFSAFANGENENCKHFRHRLWLHGNEIARMTDNGLEVAGWLAKMSQTTRERVNGMCQAHLGKNLRIPA